MAGDTDDTLVTLLEEDSFLYDSIIKVNFPINPSMYVKDIKSELNLVWEYAKEIKDVSYNRIHNWTLFSEDIIDKIEDLYRERYILPTTGKIFPAIIDLGTKQYKIYFKLDCNYAQMCDCNNTDNVYIIKNTLKDTIEIDHMYNQLSMKNSYDDVCSICIENFADSYTYNSVLLECSHRFHTFCIQCVANITDPANHKCPMCREPIVWELYPQITPIRYSHMIRIFFLVPTLNLVALSVGPFLSFLVFAINTL